MKKKCELSSCGKEFEPNSNRQRFCTNKCKRKAAIIAGGQDVTSAAEVAPPEKPKSENIIPTANVEPWIKKVHDFCIKENITPDDLIDVYNQKKPPKQKKKEEPVSDGSTVITTPRNRATKEPEPGTNAYFIRHGKYYPDGK